MITLVQAGLDGRIMTFVVGAPLNPNKQTNKQVGLGLDLTVSLEAAFYLIFNQ